MAWKEKFYGNDLTNIFDKDLLNQKTVYLGPVLCIGVESHHLGEADVLVLVEGPGVRGLVGVIDGQGGAARIVNETGVARGLAWGWHI